MRVYLSAVMATTVTLGAYATEPLHIYPASSIEFYATDSVENIDVSGDFVEFHVVDTEIFATALVFKDTRNQYPQLEAFSEQFLNRVYASNINQVFSQLEVQSRFSNSVVNGREYLIDAKSGICELLLTNAVGDSTYIFFNVTYLRGNAKCEDSGRKLRSIAKKITASIAVSGI